MGCEEVVIKAPVSGHLIDIKDVADTVFSEKMLGNGIAILPDSGEIYAPFDSIVEQVFETKHAILLCGDNNVMALIHIGLNTVCLQGKGFETFVKEGDTVKSGDLLIKADLDFIKANNYHTITPIVVVNTNDYKEVCVINNNEPASVGTAILRVK